MAKTPPPPPTLWCPACMGAGITEALVWSRVVGQRVFCQSNEKTGHPLNIEKPISKPYWLGKCGATTCAARKWLHESFGATRWYEIMLDKDSRALKLLIIQTSRAQRLADQGGKPAGEDTKAS